MASSKAKRESRQISVEVVASARQANQKRALIARREELEATWESAKEEVGSPKMEGRKKTLGLTSKGGLWHEVKDDHEASKDR